MVFKQLDRTPRQNVGHVWADYVELLCLVNPDRQLTQADIQDRIDDRKDLGEELHEVSSDDIERGEVASEDQVWDEDPIEDHEDADSRIGSVRALMNDVRDQRIADWFRHLEYRAAALGELYPFRIVDGGTTIERVTDLSNEQKLYVMLLLCANLRYVTQSAELPHWFETVSARGMARLLPAGAEVYLFGAGGEVERYRGRLWNKIQQLAADIHAKVIADERDWNRWDAGDGGLDVVGWAPLPDKQPARLVLFGQCACTDKWVIKQVSSGPLWWMDRMRFRAPPANIVFIPHFFRDATGEWHREDDIKQSILIDRFRLLRMLQDGQVAAPPQSAQDLIDRALASEEPLF